MSITASFIFNAIENGVKGEYRLETVTKVTFTFDYLKNLVFLNYEGIKDGKEVSGRENPKPIDRTNSKLKMLPMMEKRIEALPEIKVMNIKLGKEIVRIKLTLNSKAGGFDTELFIEKEGMKPQKQVHLIKI